MLCIFKDFPCSVVQQDQTSLECDKECEDYKKQQKQEEEEEKKKEMEEELRLQKVLWLMKLLPYNFKLVKTLWHLFELLGPVQVSDWH